MIDEEWLKNGEEKAGAHSIHFSSDKKEANLFLN